MVGGVLARTFNVLSVVHSHAYFPVYSNGLKDVAAHLGFVWSESDASGVQSVVWRRRWEETGSEAWKDKLTTYNLEDCAALRKVTEFLHAASNGFAVAEVGQTDSVQTGPHDTNSSGILQ